MYKHILWAAFAAVTLLFSYPTVPRAQSAATFVPLGLSPAGFASVQSEAWRTSADGSVVIGQYWEPNGSFFRRRGFRWQASTGMQDLGALDPNAIEVQPLGVSDDGSKIVGWARGVSGFQRPFVWTAATGMQELVEVPGTDARATGISRDGRLIAGYFLEGTEQAFILRDGIVTRLGFLAGETDSFARAVCGLGTAVVGSTQSAGGRAFRWTAAGGMRDLGSLRIDSPSYALHCSDDGSVVVGVSGDDKGLPPARWDSTGIRSLGTLGGNSGEAHSVSADGSIIVGAAGLPFVNGISEFAAFRWTTATRKVEQLSRVLQNLGVSMPFCHDPNTCPAGSWFVQFALGISADAQVIVGAAVNPDNVLEAYRAVVPAAGSGSGSGTIAACSTGFAKVTLTVNAAPGATVGTVISRQTSSTGSALTVSSGQSASACFQSNKTLGFEAQNNRIADWSGSPAFTCKDGNTRQNRCEFALGTASQSVTATLR